MKNLKIKLIVTTVSVLLFIMVIWAYYSDNSMDWNTEKIISCVFVSLWVSFIPQVVTYFFYKIKKSELKYSVSLGYEIGIRGFLGFIFAPFYGIRFYFMDLHGLKYNDE